MIVYHFQIMAQLSRLLQRKIPVLYQRNRDIVFDQKHIIFNAFCLIFSLQIKRNTSYILENSRIITKCHMRQNFFRLPVIYSLKCIFAFSFQYQSDAQPKIFFFFSSSHFINTFNLVHVLVPFPVLVPVQ